MRNLLSEASSLMQLLYQAYSLQYNLNFNLYFSNIILIKILLLTFCSVCILLIFICKINIVK